MGFEYAFRNINKFNELKGIIFELLYADKYHDAIPGCSWLPTEGFSIYPSGWAVGYPYLYVVFRILNDIRPKSILECGMGQSSRLINQYYKNNNDTAYVIVEHDKDWIDHMKQEISCEMINLEAYMTTKVYADISQKNAVERYKGFKEALAGRTFDFISIDGPHGDAFHDKYSRIDLLDILPDCLEKSFIILFDDCDRKGEQNTCKLICNILKKHNIDHFTKTFTGIKPIKMIASSDYFFLKHI